MIIDALGRTFDFPTPPRRVVSLVPSITETLFDLGAGSDVIAITDWCIFPPDLPLARVGGTKNPDVDAIRRLMPDLVHMNLEENVRKHADAIASFAPVFVTEPKTVGDVTTLIETLGAIHARTAAAREISAAVTRELTTIPARRFTFACAIWKKPWMWCGGDTYVSSLATAGGGTNLLADEKRYPQHTVEEIAAMRPDVIFLPDEPYAFTQTDAREMAEATGARVVGPFPGHLFTWHGSRTVHGLRFLRRAL